METRDFLSCLSSGDLSSLPAVLILEGEEAYLRRKALADLERLVLPEGLEEMNRSVLENPSADEIIAAAETLPFLADRRLVIIPDYPALTGRAEADELLLAYLPSVPSSVFLVFLCSGKADGRKKLYSAVKKLNGVVSFAPLKDQELVSFVVSAFRDHGRACDCSAAEQLIFTCGSDATLLLSEVAKIASHDLSGAPVSSEEITSLATPSVECTVFQMVDAVVDGQNTRALTLMRNQILSGADRVFLITMLLRQFRLLQHVKIMQYEKKSKEYIRAALGVPSFAAERYIRQASFFSGGQVRDAFRLCLDTEYRVKSGRISADGALETLILKLLTLRRKD